MWPHEVMPGQKSVGFWKDVSLRASNRNTEDERSGLSLARAPHVTTIKAPNFNPVKNSRDSMPRRIFLSRNLINDSAKAGSVRSEVKIQQKEERKDARAVLHSILTLHRVLTREFLAYLVIGGSVAAAGFSGLMRMVLTSGSR